MARERYAPATMDSQGGGAADGESGRTAPKGARRRSEQVAIPRGTRGTRNTRHV